MSLQDIDIKDTYSSSTKDHDLVLEFYNPVLEQAVSYDRITGFFSPAILAVASRGFAGLISTGGKIRLITSVQLDDKIYESIVNDKHKLDDELLADFDVESIKSELDKDYLAVFAWLYRTGQLEMKVAITSKGRSMLHQKIGIVTDADGNSISFSGSNNETPNGWQHNIEQFKVFKSWNPYTISFYQSDKIEFDVLWRNLSNKADVVYVDSAIKDKLIQKIERHRKDDINTVVKRIRKREHENKMRIMPARERDVRHPEAPGTRTAEDDTSKQNNDKASARQQSRELRDYQVNAIKHWIDNGYKSIFEMATGTGKTFTAINALKTFSDSHSYMRAVVVVPLTTLTIQWQEDIQKIIPGIKIVNTSTSSDWKNELSNLALYKKLGRSSDFIVITTYSMFTREDFNERLQQLGDDLVLLADEMHNLVNKPRIRALANPIYKYKLGLSATPTRLWSQEDSRITREYFGDNSYQFSLNEAIRNGFLVPYNYHPLPIQLTGDEYEKYVELSRQITRLLQYKNSNSDDNQTLNMKLIERSRIKKNAGNKILALESSFHALQKKGPVHNALIYVDNEDFLSELQRMLTENNIRTSKFTGDNSVEERLSTINNLRNHSINAIVAIKCLDEGVDIPSAKTAFFLSNNTDPREYVQRLGRVLRQDPIGNKTLSEIYDYIVVPPSGISYESESDRNIARNMIKNELIRSKFFNELSSNASEAQDIIDDAVDGYGFYYEENELEYNLGEEIAHGTTD